MPGVIPGLAPFAIDFTREVYFLLLIPYTALVAGATYLGRKSFLANKANQQAFAALALSYGAICLQRLQVWLTHEDHRIALNNELLFLGLSISLLAIVVERRLIWSSLPLWLGFFFGLWQPTWAMEIFGVATAVTLFTMSYAWLNPALINPKNS
jgi:hypothetical protein